MDSPISPIVITDPSDCAAGSGDTVECVTEPWEKITTDINADNKSDESGDVPRLLKSKKLLRHFFLTLNSQMIQHCT